MIIGKNILPLIIVCSCIVACKSADKEKQATDPNPTNTLESLITPDVSTQTSSGSLQDIWVLDSIISKEKYDVNLVNNTPVLDLDTVKNSLSGHTGCNSLSSKLKVQGNKLLFDSVQLTSNQPCSDKGFERKLLSILRSGNTTYKIVDDKLYVNVGAGSEFIYRRIRR